MLFFGLYRIMVNKVIFVVLWGTITPVALPGSASAVGMRFSLQDFPKRAFILISTLNFPVTDPQTLTIKLCVIL